MVYSLTNLPESCIYYDNPDGFFLRTSVQEGARDRKICDKGLNHSRPTFGIWEVCEDGVHARAHSVIVFNKITEEKQSCEQTRGTIRRIDDIFSDFQEGHEEYRADQENSKKKLKNEFSKLDDSPRDVKYIIGAIAIVILTILLLIGLIYGVLCPI